MEQQQLLKIPINNLINPLSFPQEITTNLHRSTFLDASLYELPNISIDKNHTTSFSLVDSILINKFKDNELEIVEFIRSKYIENQSRILMIDRDEFIKLFKIKDYQIIERIFNKYKQNNNSNSNGNGSIKNRLSSSSSSFRRSNSFNNTNLQHSLPTSFDYKKKSKISRSRSRKNLKLNQLQQQESTTTSIERNEIENTLKIPMGDCGSYPIIVDINSSNNQQISNYIESPIEVQPHIHLVGNSPSIHQGMVSSSSSSNLSGVSSSPTSTKSFTDSPYQDKQNTLISNEISVEQQMQQIHQPQTQSLPTIIKINNNDDQPYGSNNNSGSLHISKSKSFSNSFSNKKQKILKATRSRSKSLSSSSSNSNLIIDLKINIFDLINQIYLNLSKVGTEDEKITSVFKLYDIFNKGFITRNDLKEVLIYRTKQNGLKFQDFTMESLIDHIFEQFDKNNDGQIDFQEFKNELTITNKFETPRACSSNDTLEISTSSCGSSNSSNCSSINSNSNTSSTKKPTDNSKGKHSLKRYFKIEGSKLFFILLFSIVNIVLIINGFFMVYSKNQKALELFGPGLYITRISAQLIEFNGAIILVTMCKQLFTMVRNTRFKALFPVDKYMTFHKLIGYTLIIASFLHTIGWFVGMAIATSKPDTVFYECLSPHFKFRPTVWEMIFNSLPGVTGFVMVSVLTIMGAFSLKVVRKSNFELFYYSHHLFIVFYILLILHGTMGWIRPPTFWKWFIVPSFLYACDRGFRLFKKTYRVEVLEYSLKNERVINLTFSKPSSFNYKPGQYLLINIPQISKLQWHPFTMTSSPLEENVHVHIRVTGGWTKKLFKWLTIKQQQKLQSEMYTQNNGIDLHNFDLEIASKSLSINIDGPFGSSSQYALSEKQVILVGAGIGVAPMASLLKDISLKKQRNETLGNLEKVHFFWLNRDQLCFQWFEDLLVDISRNGNHHIPKISINTFNTRVFPKSDVRVFMLWNGLDKLFKEQGLDPTTNLPFKTHWGRPNWDTIFQYYSNKYSGESISVFCCGPPQLSKELYEKCKYNTNLKQGGTKFNFHKENF